MGAETDGEPETRGHRGCVGRLTYWEAAKHTSTNCVDAVLRLIVHFHTWKMNLKQAVQVLYAGIALGPVSNQ